MTITPPNSWVADNFLPILQYIEMKRTFPTVTNAGVRAMHDLSCVDDEYKTHIARNPMWREFHDMIFSKAFWEIYFPAVRGYAFYKDHMEPRHGVAEPTLDRFLYARIDIGVATMGYGINNGGRGVHIDNAQRIISGLLYFTDQSELEGGEFCFCTQKGELTRMVPLKENRCVISHQNKDAWHYVNPLTKGTRRFVYFSLNSTWEFYKRHD